MSYSDYSKYFGEQHNGPFQSVKLLTLPIKPLRDVNVSDSQQQELKDILMASERGQNKILALHDKSTSERALLVNTAAYKLMTPVCFVSCTRFVKHYIGETEKNVSSLLARAETKNWIMFFHDADALFKAYSAKESNDKDLLNIRRAYLIKQMSAYSGLVVLSINTRTCLDSVFYATERLNL